MADYLQNAAIKQDEFDREFDGQTPHEILVEKCPDLFFQIDTYWVAVGGKNPVEVIKKLGPRAPTLHIKDGPMVKTEAMTAVGEGKIALPTVAGQLLQYLAVYEVHVAHKLRIYVHCN